MLTARRLQVGVAALVTAAAAVALVIGVVRPCAAHDATTGVADATPLTVDARRALLAERAGFGRRAGSGALDWPVVEVTSLADAGRGTLRAALAEGGRWIWFRPGLRGTIELASSLVVPDDVVVDGRGAAVTLRGSSSTVLMQITDAHNVVIAHLAFDGGEDAIHLFQGTRDVWLHHLSARRAGDELMSMTGEGRRPDAITVSWSRFEEAGRALLLGGSPTDEDQAPQRVTLHHNLFVDVHDRQPLVRFARVHLFNNVILDWGTRESGQAVRVGLGAAVVSEANLIDGSRGRPAIAAEDAATGLVGRVRSEGDVVPGTSEIVESRPAEVFDPSDEYTYEAESMTSRLRARVERQAGAPAG